MFIKIITIEYILIFSHELIHLIASLFLGFKCNLFHVIPFTIYRYKSRFKISLKPRIENNITSRCHFENCKLSSSLDYLILLKKIKIFLWIGPIFDFLIILLLFCIGISIPSLFFLTLTSIFHLIISTMNFFNSDGKYAIGSKEDKRIAFDLVRMFSICGDGLIPEESKRIMTDKHLNISNTINWVEFDVNDLWNFLNNISFFTNSLLSYLNNDIISLHPSTISFFETLIRDFDKIKDLDYRQEEKTSISIILYFIYMKLQSDNFIPPYEISKKVYKYCNSIYYKKLYDYYFNNKILNELFLINENNMPIENRNCHGFSKLLKNIIVLNKRN
ncbi:hypothetical protein [Clostridium carnis]